MSVQSAEIVRAPIYLCCAERRADDMGMGNPEPIYYTADMVRDLIREDRAWPRYETVRGELLVTPAPRVTHQRVVLRLAYHLMQYIEREPIGEVFTSPADISWKLPDVLVQPDVFVISPESSRAATDEGWPGVMHLLLAAEVLSPGSTRQDRFTKRRLYQERGVPTYWVIDVDDRSVEIWTTSDALPRVERERLHWHPAGAREPCAIAIADLLV